MCRGRIHLTLIIVHCLLEAAVTMKGMEGRWLKGNGFLEAAPASPGWRRSLEFAKCPFQFCLPCYILSPRFTWSSLFRCPWRFHNGDPFSTALWSLCRVACRVCACSFPKFFVTNHVKLENALTFLKSKSCPILCLFRDNC